MSVMIAISYEELEKENTLLWEANKRLQQQIAEHERETVFLRAKIASQAQDIDWYIQIGRVPSATVSTSHKATARALRKLLREKTPNADGYYEVAAWELTRIEAISEGTHLENINYLSHVFVDSELRREAELPLFEKRLVQIVEPGKRGKPTYRVFLKPLPLLEQPTYWESASPRQHGGAGRNQGRRKKCECGGEIIERDITLAKQRIEECQRCHRIHSADEPRSVHAPYLPTSPSQDGEGIKNQLDFNSPPLSEDRIYNQLEVVDSYLVPPQVDCKSEEEEDDSNESALDESPSTALALVAGFPDMATQETPAQELLASQKTTEPLQLAISSVSTLVSNCKASANIPPLQDAMVKVEQVEPPVELRSRNIWVCWRYEPKKDKEGNIVPGKLDKVPYIADRGRASVYAKSNDATTWRTYEQAQAEYERSRREGWKRPYDGIGFMCDGSFTVIDYDHCVEEGEMISEQVQARIQSIHTYSELSPSCTGVHQIVFGTIERGVKRPEIEMYCKGRFLTFTGKHIVGTPLTIEDRSEELNALFLEIAPVIVPASEPQPAKLPAPSIAPLCSDEQILEKARNARNGAKFTALWEGCTDGYASLSEADLALCSMLAFWADNHVDTIDRLFRQSCLYREEKWERNARAGEKYGEGTIRRAIGVKVAL